MKKAEKEHLQKVAELGCIACMKLGHYDTPAEIHHIRKMGEPRNHYRVIPLCPHHHRSSNESYHLNPLWFSEKFGTQQELLEETLRLING
tara:strand:- start:117 stop:386 length:270 start_codon:yes stop_codon:yes gene_type:complete